VTGDTDADVGCSDGWDTDAEIDSDGAAVPAALAVLAAEAVVVPLTAAEPELWQPAVPAISVTASATADGSARIRKVKASPGLSGN
jgi:hypothetical protein